MAKLITYQFSDDIATVYGSLKCTLFTAKQIALKLSEEHKEREINLIDCETGEVMAQYSNGNATYISKPWQ